MSNNSARPRGLGDFASMPNGRPEKASQGLPPYGTQPASNIWSLNFPSDNRGSDGADSFAVQTDAWNQLPTRSTSGSASPKKSRHAQTASSSFFDSSMTANTQGRAFPTGYSNTKAYRDDEKENTSFAAAYTADAERTLNAHERQTSYTREMAGYRGLGSFAAPPSREGSNPPSRHSDGSSQQSSPPAIAPPFGTNPSLSYSSRLPGTDPLNPSATQRHRQQQPSFDRARHAAVETASFAGFSSMPVPQKAQSPWQMALPGAPQAGRGNVEVMAAHAVANSRVPEAVYHPRTVTPKMAMGRAVPLPPFMPEPQAQFYAGAPVANYGNFAPQMQMYDPYFYYALLNPGAVPHGQPITTNNQQDSGVGMSALLAELRSYKNPPVWDLSKMYGHIVEFSGDQSGSRQIQRALEFANSEEKERAFQEMQSNTVQMMKDLFGNYVIQKFFEHGNMNQKRILASHMTGKVAELSTQMYACRVVQKAFEHILVEQQAVLVRELAVNTLQIIQDQNGNHVIQRVIQSVSGDHTGFLYDAVRGKVFKLSNHTYGCRVIQRMLEYGSPAQKDSLVGEIMLVAPGMCNDPYGNYVVQHVIEKGGRRHRAEMIQLIFRTGVTTLSKHKHASNVVEMVMKKGTPADRTAILKMVTEPAGATGPLPNMMKDQFANYVIQKLLVLLGKGNIQRQQLLDAMEAELPALKPTLVGRQIQTVEKLISLIENPALIDQLEDKGNRSSGRLNHKDSGRRSSGLEVDVNSAAQTPVLTMEQNSPQSSSPPSTNSSSLGDSGTVGDSIEGPKGGLLRSLEGPLRNLSLQDNDADRY